MKMSLIFFLSTFTIASATQSGIEIFKQCGACHGDKGQKHSLNVTKYIAGMDKNTVVKILHEYKDGKRNIYGLGSMMKGQAGKLSDAEIKAVASYVAYLPKVEIKQSVKKKDTKTLDGAKIFKRCAICHGKNAHKKSLKVSKIIAGMDKDHIIETLHKYQSGELNQYGYGRMMKGQAKKLNEKQLEAVATYIQSIEKIKIEAPQKAKRLTEEKAAYNKFLAEHFANSKDPNETLKAGDKKWNEYGKKEWQEKQKKKGTNNQ